MICNVVTLVLIKYIRSTNIYITLHNLNNRATLAKVHTLKSGRSATRRAFPLAVRMWTSFLVWVRLSCLNLRFRFLNGAGVRSEPRGSFTQVQGLDKKSCMQLQGDTSGQFKPIDIKKKVLSQ